MSTLRPPMGAALETRPLNVNLQFLRENIQSAQRKNCPQSEYTRAVVIFISWARDPIAENKHRADLARLFAKTYHYYLEEYTIPNDVGTMTACGRVHEVLSVFMKRHDAEDTLLIVVYHGVVHKMEDRCIWLANVAPESPAIDWSTLRETTLDLAQADMLYIFDCCYKPGSHHGTNYELLAATEVIHPIEEEWRHSSNSFTAKLVKVLTILDGEPATVVQIYALLMREAYLDLKKTFTVAPIHRRNSDREFAVKLQPLHTSSIIPEFRLHQLLETAPKVLITAFVQRPAPGNEMIEWRQFLMDSSPRIPSLEVTVEAVYETDSKTWIIHLLVPVDIWALLWDHQPALRFEEFVTSGNIKGSLSYVHGPFQTTEPSFKEGGGHLSGISGEKGQVAIKEEEVYSSDSSETVHGYQPVSKKEVSPENMDVDHRVLPRDSHSAPGACHEGSEHVVKGQNELLAVARIENGMENMDSDEDDGAVQLNNPHRGPDMFVDNISGRLRKRTRSQPWRYKV